MATNRTRLWCDTVDSEVPLPVFIPESSTSAPTTENSIPILTGGQSQKVTVTAASAQSSAITTDKINIYADVDCFVRQGTDPTALADGTDQIIPAGVMLRGYEITSGNKLAFIAVSTSGNVYLTPGG
jgi:hypothetical protein